MQENTVELHLAAVQGEEAADHPVLANSAHPEQQVLVRATGIGPGVQIVRQVSLLTAQPCSHRLGHIVQAQFEIEGKRHVDECCGTAGRRANLGNIFTTGLLFRPDHGTRG